VSSPDTIAAIASAPGRGAVGVIRVSGPGVPHVAQEVLGFLPMPRQAQVSNFHGSGGEPLDRGLALYFPAPASYTGEHVLELQGHGGLLIMDLLLQRLLELGCRMAKPGEFSERAFLNGKIDIAQAEAIADLIDAGTTAAARAAVRSMQGEFSARINALQAQITELRTLVEGFQMTAQGQRKLGYGTVQAGGGKGPGTAVGLATFLATANPAGLTERWDIDQQVHVVKLGLNYRFR